MSEHEIGYGKPPRHSQFKKGVCANPSGRPKRRDTEIGDVVRTFLSAEARYREGANEKDVKVGIGDQTPRRGSFEWRRWQRRHAAENASASDQDSETLAR